jgi:hypothetical protein
MRNEPSRNLFPCSSIFKSRQLGWRDSWGWCVPSCRRGATYTSVTPSGLAWLSHADCCGMTDGPSALRRVCHKSHQNRWHDWPDLNRHVALSSYSLLSLPPLSSLSALSPSRAVAGHLPLAVVRPQCRSSSSKVAPPEPCRFSSYYLYCFIWGIGILEEFRVWIDVG